MEAENFEVIAYMENMGLHGGFLSVVRVDQNNGRLLVGVHTGGEYSRGFFIHRVRNAWFAVGVPPFDAIHRLLHGVGP